jgi:hypothetical protein
MSVVDRLQERCNEYEVLKRQSTVIRVTRSHQRREDDAALLALVRAVQKADELFEMIVADLDPEDVAEIEQVRTALDAVRKVD